MKERVRVYMDGLKEVPKEELHSFVKKAVVGMAGVSQHKHPQWCIYIPTQIAHSLNLERDDFLLVAIKKASEQEKVEYVVK